MQTVQKASEQLLLSFYYRYSTHGYITNETIELQHDDDEWTLSVDDDNLNKALLAIVDNSVVLLKNAFQYLHQKKLVSFESNGSFLEAIELYDISVTHKGIDIVEGVSGAKN